MSQVVIEAGNLNATSGPPVEYEIREGRSFQAAIECDKLWLDSLWDAATKVEAMGLSPTQENEMLEGLQLEAAHWRWSAKMATMDKSEYIWFFMYAEGLPQGVCILYHPRESVLGSGKIFYLEYLAAAPWNRTCKIWNRRFSLVGRTLLCAALKYAVNNLGLSLGCSLHSLPQAAGWYNSLKMVHIPGHEKEGLAFYELPSEAAENLINAA